MTFYIFHRHRVYLVDYVDLISSLYSWWKGFKFSSLPSIHGTQLQFYHHLFVGHPQDFALEVALEDLGLLQ